MPEHLAAHLLAQLLGHFEGDQVLRLCLLFQHMRGVAVADLGVKVRLIAAAQIFAHPRQLFDLPP